MLCSDTCLLCCVAWFTSFGFAAIVLLLGLGLWFCGFALVGVWLVWFAVADLMVFVACLFVATRSCWVLLGCLLVVLFGCVCFAGCFIVVFV